MAAAGSASSSFEVLAATGWGGMGRSLAVAVAVAGDRGGAGSRRRR
jgi:hypothetical protein